MLNFNVQLTRFSEEEKEDKVVATVATKVECKDTETAAQCLDWKNLGYCKSTSEYNGYMKKSCSKTCGFCVSTSTTTTTSGKVSRFASFLFIKLRYFSPFHIQYVTIVLKMHLIFS